MFLQNMSPARRTEKDMHYQSGTSKALQQVQTAGRAVPRAETVVAALAAAPSGVWEELKEEQSPSISPNLCQCCGDQTATQ